MKIFAFLTAVLFFVMMAVNVSFGQSALARPKTHAQCFRQHGSCYERHCPHHMRQIGDCSRYERCCK